MNQKHMQDEQIQVIENTVGTPNLIGMSLRSLLTF
jgi:hypothetical protein